MKIDSCFPEFDKKNLLHAIVPRLVGFSDRKLMITSVGSELTWMFKDHFVEVFLSLLIMLVKCGSHLSMKIYRFSILDAEEWGMGLVVAFS
ncbi:hypothetical protein Goshw_013987 [Gossypium schwendimanii]|uniref:Uncharacterized protein n=1 Tax=Gossypium schwendimanii TaxID=34291 RepID=A0A7J9LN65_GOSSC|nr:hypothetical protein [Gossypium schwendimanii]